MKIEIPITDLTHPESHYIEVIDHTKSIIISPYHQKLISSLRLFLYLNPEKRDSFDRLRVKLIRHSDSLPVYEKTYFLIQILNEEIQIPLPYGCQIDDDACVLEIKTDAPINSVGLWKIGDPPKTGSAQMESLENFTRVSFEKLNVASFLILKIQRSFNFLLLISPFFLFFFLGWLVFFAINPKAFINENLVIPISLLGLGTFIVYGVLSTFLVNEHRVIRWIFLVSILLLVLLVVFLRKQDDFKSQWTKKTYIFVFLNFFLWFITYILVLAITSHHEVPPWVDGLKHLSIIDSLESGDKQPVLSGYHIGFHLIVLSLHKLLGIPAFQAALVVGIVTASFTGIMISNYAVSVTRDFHNGFLAGIILITLSPFPLYLINWSRYPFLISLIFDLTIFSLVHRAIIYREPVPKWLIILLSIYASLIHYSSAYLIFLFTISCIISSKKADAGLKSYLQQIKSNYWIVLIPLVLVIYVFISINHGYGFQNLIMLRSEEVESYGQIIGLASKRFGWLVILLSVISLIRQLIEKDRNGVLFLCFLSLLFIGQLVQKIILDAMFFSWINLMILIMCLLPLLTSRLLVDVGKRLFKVPEFQGIAFITLILGLIQIGFSSTSSVIQPSITRFTSNDFVVINWIKTNFRDEKFLINFMDWGGEIVPSDAGGWIGIMTDNHIVQPLYSSVDSSLCEWIRNEKPNYYLDGHGEKFVNYHQLDCVEFSEITVQGEEIIYQVKILDQY